MDDEPERQSHRHHFVFFFFILAFIFSIGTIGPEKAFHMPQSAPSVASTESTVDIPPAETIIRSEISSPHQEQPYRLHGIYLTGWKAGTTSGLAHAHELIEGGIVNAVIIDIKDSTGKLSYEPLDPILAATGVGTKRIRDLAGVIKTFHDRGVYVIGRVAVFQDPFYSHLHPEDALHDTRTGGVWTDYKNIAWLRPDSVAVWDYTAAIAHDAYTQGFDEINLDYVRFPSDGELKFIDMTHMAKNKAETIQDFFAGMDERVRAEGVGMSADVFGLTMSAGDDVGIGQKAVLIAPHVDALAPMIYPSHFWNGTYGIPVPAKEPYKVIFKSLSDGIAKLAAAGIEKEKLRPWLQDFDLLGVAYTPDMVRAQIEAARDVGIESWMLWDPRNNYTKEVLGL